jgi:hypothetical protein
MLRFSGILFDTRKTNMLPSDLLRAALDFVNRNMAARINERKNLLYLATWGIPGSRTILVYRHLA